MSGIESWSTTPANNNQAPPFGWPAGILPSQVEPIGRQMMTSVAAWYQAAEWINYNLTPTYVSGTQFTLPGNDTAIYHVGRRVKATDGSTNVYGTITASAFTTLTTVTVVWDSGVLQTGVTIVYVGITSAVNTSAPALSLAISPTWTGNHTFTPASGVAAVFNGVANSNAVQIQGSSTSGQSLGLRIRAGTTSADNALNVVNTGATATLALVRGDGSTTWGYNGSASTITTSAGGGVAISGPASSVVALTVNGPGNALALQLNGAAAVRVAQVDSTAANGPYVAWSKSSTDLGYLGSAINLGIGAATDMGLRSEGNLYLLSGGASSRVAISSTGAVVVNTPASGVALTVNGIANQNTALFQAPVSAGVSVGPIVQAGTNSADIAFRIYNAAGTTGYFIVRGDGLAQAIDQGGSLQDVGWRGVPFNTPGGSYTLTLADRGKTINISTGATITVPNGVFGPGDAVSFYLFSGSATIAQGASFTMGWAGNGATTGNRTITGAALATVVFQASSQGLISGAGLS